MGGVAQSPSPVAMTTEKVAIDSMLLEVEIIECRLCHELKDRSQFEPHRRQCNRCRNRYREQVRDVEKRRAHQRVRDRRYRLKLKQQRALLTGQSLVPMPMAV